MTGDAPWIVRSEEPQDADGIDRVHRRAFEGDNAADLVRALRDRGGYENALSIVAVSTGPNPRVLGHVLFSPIAIVRGDVPAPALALGPLGVMPDTQRQGVGTAIVRAGLEACRDAGHGIVLVLGDPAYYSRFGFELAGTRDIRPPDPDWAGAFQVLGLTSRALDGVHGEVRYPSAWDDV